MKRTEEQKTADDKVTLQKMKGYYKQLFTTKTGKEVIKDLVAFAQLHHAFLPNVKDGFYDPSQIMCYREGQKSLILRMLTLAGDYELVDVMQDLINQQITENNETFVPTY